MAFDQNSISKDLRPLNVALTMAEEPLISPATTSSLSPNSVRELSYQPSTSTSATGATWCVRPVAHPNVNPAAFGFNCFGNQVAAGNAWNLGNWVGASGFDKACNDGIAINGYTYSALQGARVVGKASDQVSTPASHQVDQSGDDASDDSVLGRKVKFLCSFGGKILPRPSDGMLRYVGGQTRIISVRKDVSFNDLLQKMVDTYGQPVVIKYQLPEEDLDALVSISCPDDVENMMEEYEKLVERSLDGSAKLRVFLFSASELELSTRVQFGDLQDTGQKYVDAVNGITEGNVTSGGINRKESGASATSTQNSDFSGTETLDSLTIGTGDVSEAPRSYVLSPRENSKSSPNSSANLVVSEPSASIHSGASAVSLGVPGAMASPTQNRYFRNEVELQKFVPATLSQQPFGLQQFGMEISSPPSPYLQPFVDPSQEIINHADYVPLSPQIGFPNPHLLGKTASVFSQQQFHDNTPSLAFHQVLPGVQMTMAQPSSHVGVGLNVIQPQPMVQPMQHHLDQYNDGNTSGIRIIQFPTEHSYNRYQVPVNQVPSVIVGGNYGWVQVPPQEQVVFSDGSSPQQHVAIHEKIQRVEDCSLCQKKLPHAHSDPVPMVEDQHNSGLGSNPDSTPSYHSFPMEENPKTQPTNRVMLTLTQPLNEGIAEQGAGTRPRSSSELDPSNGVPSTEMTGLSHKLESQPNDGRNFIQNSEEFIQPRNSFLTDIPSEGFMGKTKVSCLDNLVYHNVVPVENWVKQDALMNKPVNNDIHMVDVTTTQTSECTVQEYPKEYTNVRTNVVSKSGLVDNWFREDHLKPIEGRIDTHKVGDSDVCVSNDHCLLPIDNKPNGNGKVNYNSQSALEEEVILDNNFGRSKLMVDANQNNETGVLPCSGIEILYGHNSRPGEYNDNSQPSAWEFLGPNSQSKISNHHKDDMASSSMSPSVRFGDAQDTPDSLFSNQDPWNIQHGTCFSPTRPSKASLQKETYSHKDHLGENLSNCSDPNLQAQLDDNLYQSLRRDLTLENSQPSKGSAEDQQLQAVAEDVAASVLHPCTALNHDLHARDVSCPENIEDGGIQNNLKDVKCQDTTQDIKKKQPEKAKFSFPTSGVGGLQVIKNCDLEELTELGSGTFGTVYHGKWRGSDVAIKQITNRCFAGKPSEQERMRNDFWNEAIKLADLHHPNVVAFYGVVLDGPGSSVATVTEYMVNGSLRNALQKSERNLDKCKRLLIAMDVAFGMEYLHGKNIVHFDLKSDNLLVNLRDPHRPICKVIDVKPFKHSHVDVSASRLRQPTWSKNALAIKSITTVKDMSLVPEQASPSKVGDLGLSKVKRQTLISGGVRGTLPWMAPELLNGSSSLVSEKVDVFSFGVVMWELLTGEEPYADLHYGAIIGGIVSNTLRPPVPESCDLDWELLMERCWSSEPSERPSFTEIANELRSMASKISSPRAQNQHMQPSLLHS